MSPTNPFEESPNPFEHDSTADARTSSQVHVEVIAFTARSASVYLLHLSRHAFGECLKLKMITSVSG